MSMIDMTASPDVAALDFNTAREMAEVLHSAYPDHLWAVTCEGEKGIATVRNLSLSGQWGFILKLREMYTSSDWKKRVLVAGGELLERYKLRRGAADAAAIADLKTDFSGRIVGDMSK